MVCFPHILCSGLLSREKRTENEKQNVTFLGAYSRDTAQILDSKSLSPHFYLSFSIRKLLYMRKIFFPSLFISCCINLVLCDSGNQLVSSAAYEVISLQPIRRTHVTKQANSKIPDILQKSEREILHNWMEQHSGTTRRSELQAQSAEFLSLFRDAVRTDLSGDVTTDAWSKVDDFLVSMSRSRAEQGFTPSETATFVLSLKQPLFTRLRQEYGKDAEGLADDVWNATEIIDKLALHTTEAYHTARGAVINRQQQELLELSTPVVELWQGILAIPLIGTLDSERTQIVMESLLQRIIDTNSAIAIIDITGVPTVDTLVAQHLLKTVAAARLMGADCLISGIRPQIAQTIVHLGVDLTNVITKASLADAFSVALQRRGLTVKKKSEGKGQTLADGEAHKDEWEPDFMKI
jgi:rsbT co-antagonist protein RsbR